MCLLCSQIFSKDSQEERGENARLSTFVGATAIADLVSYYFYFYYMQSLTFDAQGKINPWTKGNE